MGMMNVLLGVLVLTLCSSLVQTLTTNAKSCDFCSPTGSNCIDQDNYVVCACKFGYQGNGLNCTRITFCDTLKCCIEGYYWNRQKKICDDINECSSPTLNKCSPTQTCVNYFGTYLCTPNSSALCSGETCSSDKDCIKVNDNFVCADPCVNYSDLNGDSRLSTIESTGRFNTDRYNYGWFRYVGSLTASMKEGPVGLLRCGSLEPFTLAEGHPSIGDGIKMVTLLSNLLSSNVTGGSLPVKACSGEYYVYKFSGMLRSDVYCTGGKIQRI
ncbi:uromodulin-like [Phyllobates terribilis]|uniref:uromodulin-like n=1 Tax=Phyllobates terribilis TaxID=111132 RepID=UPI003CCA7A1B